MSRDDKKRSRSSNFSNEEKLLALNVISNYLKIIENKTTGTITWREKEVAWEKITDEFNSQSSSNIFRSRESLKKFYENKKRETRKVCAEEKKEIYATGGGVATTPKFDPTIELARQMMNKKTVDGLTNNFDGDRLNNNADKNDDSIPVNWGDYKVQYLQTPLSQELRTRSPITITSIDAETLGEAILTSASSNKSYPLENASSNTFPPLNMTNNNETQSSISGDQIIGKNKKRVSSQEWQNRRRPKSDLAPSTISKQYSDLAEIKLELAKLELQILKENSAIRSQREQEEHSLKITALRLDIKIKEKTLERLISNM